jgi:hypothetical protein
VPHSCAVFAEAGMCDKEQVAQSCRRSCGLCEAGPPRDPLYGRWAPKLAQDIFDRFAEGEGAEARMPRAQFAAFAGPAGIAKLAEPEGWSGLLGHLGLNPDDGLGAADLARLYTEAFGPEELVAHHASVARPSDPDGWSEQRVAAAKEEAGREKREAADATTHLVSPNAGRLVIFSSGRENLHQVQKVETGTRTVLSMWFTCDEEKAFSTFLDGSAHVAFDQGRAGKRRRKRKRKRRRKKEL